MRSTTTPRLVLTALVLGVALGCAWLHQQSLEAARDWPELAHLRVPLLVAVVAGFLPVLAAVGQLLRLLGLVDAGEATSPQALRALRRARLSVAILAAYLAVGLLGFWAVVGLLHVTLLLAWAVAEVAAVAASTALGRAERACAASLAQRREVQLTA